MGTTVQKGIEKWKEGCGKAAGGNEIRGTIMLESSIRRPTRIRGMVRTEIGGESGQGDDGQEDHGVTGVA